MSEEKKLDRYSPQCVLANHLFEFVRLHKESPKNYVSILGNSTKARTWLSSFDRAHPLTKMTTAQLSSLVPMNKLYSVSASGEETEFIFEDYFDISSITADQRNRGVGSGIKSVSVEMLGDRVATSSRMFSVSIKFYFSSAQELFKQRTDTAGRGYTYSQLLAPMPIGATQTNNCSSLAAKDSKNSLINSSQRYKLIFGYAEPQNSEFFNKSKKSEESLLRAIRSARRAMYLNLYKHTLDFEDNGTLSVTADYHGYVEKVVDDIDVLSVSLTSFAMDEYFNLMYAERTACSNPALTTPSSKPTNPCESGKEGEKNPPSESDEDEREAATERATDAEERARDLRTKGYQAFLNQVIMKGQIYSLSYKPEEVDSNTGRVPSLNPSLTRKKAPKGERLLNWFFYGDMLDNILTFMGSKGKSLSVGFALGTVPLADPVTGKVKDIPISSVPISVEHFKNWFKEHVIKKGERQTYNLNEFVNDSLNTLVKGATEPICFVDSNKVAKRGIVVPSFESNIFTTSTQLSGAVDFSSVSKDTLNPVDGKMFSNLFVYGVNTVSNPPSGEGSQAEDLSNGVMHLISGSEVGIVKRIKFTKEDRKYATAVAIRKGNFNKQSKLLWGVYNARVEMFGTPIFRPGMKVYLASNSMTPQEIRDSQIGGYYYITKVYNKIESGKFTTEVDCKFHNVPNARRC